MLNLYDRIANSFDKAQTTYDSHNSVQKTILDILINYVLQQQTQFDCIVDFACGTGISTAALCERFLFREIHGVDIAKKLLLMANARLSADSKLNYGNFDEVLFPESYIDLAFCNMGLQWSKQLNLTLQQLNLQLKPNAILAFSLPLKGTFTELKPQYYNRFYDQNSILTWLNASGFQLLTTEQNTFVMEFSSALDALKSIKNTGANISLNNEYKQQRGLLSPSNIKAMFINPHEVNLSYHIGFFIAIKSN